MLVGWCWQDCGALTPEADAAAATAMCFAYTGATVSGLRPRLHEARGRGLGARDDEEDEVEDDDDDGAEEAAAAAGLASGPAPVCATVLVSRSAGRYRVQVRQNP